MIDWPSRLLLAATSTVLGFALGGLALQGVPASGLIQGADITQIAFSSPGSPRPADHGQVVVGAASPVATALPMLDTAPGQTPTATPTPTPTPTTAPPITIAFAGDVHGEPPIDRILLDGDNPLEGVADWLSAADIAIVNLETAIGTGGTPMDKTFTFQADPALADRLAEAGVDVVNLANNHGLDYGYEAAAETVDILAAAGLTPVGYGEDADAAYAPEVIDVEGRSVALLGLTRVMPTLDWSAGSTRAGMASVYDVARAVQAVRLAATQADHVVVTIHWGQERNPCPVATQVELARAMAAAGADVIVGHHPHVLQGVIGIDDTLVAYSVGNFLFYARRAEQRETGVLTVTLGEDGVQGYTWQPARIDGSGRPQPLEPEVSEEPDRQPRTPLATPDPDATGCAPLR